MRKAWNTKYSRMGPWLASSSDALPLDKRRLSNRGSYGFNQARIFLRRLRVGQLFRGRPAALRVAPGGSPRHQAARGGTGLRAVHREGTPPAGHPRGDAVLRGRLRAAEGLPPLRDAGRLRGRRQPDFPAVRPVGGHQRRIHRQRAASAAPKPRRQAHAGHHLQLRAMPGRAALGQPGQRRHRDRQARRRPRVPLQVQPRGNPVPAGQPPEPPWPRKAP